jgi:TRAP-type uncharacterized transport system fused permease subunit
MGMGLPTTAAYVLVAAVLAPAMTAVGVDPLAAHMFVFYYATISVITPPVCVAVFVGAGIARTNWLPAAGEAVRLGAVTYVIPFLFLVFPGMTMQGTWFQAIEALTAGLVMVIAIPALMSGLRITRLRLLDVAILLGAVGISIWPHPVAPFIGLAVLGGVYLVGKSGRKELA